MALLSFFEVICRLHDAPWIGSALLYKITLPPLPTATPKHIKALETLEHARGRSWTNGVTQEVNAILSDLGIDITVLGKIQGRGRHGTRANLKFSEVEFDRQEPRSEKGAKLLPVAAKAVVTVREMLEKALK